MKVEDVMTRNVESCGVNQSLSAAARIMWEKDCGCVPVVDPDGRCVGMLTDRDICMAAYTQGQPLWAISVSSAMSHVVHGCLPGDSLSRAELLMRAHQVRRLPVMGFDGQLIGILSLADLAREAETHPVGGALAPSAIESTFAAVSHARLRELVH